MSGFLYHHVKYLVLDTCRLNTGLCELLVSSSMAFSVFLTCHHMTRGEEGETWTYRGFVAQNFIAVEFHLRIFWL